MLEDRQVAKETRGLQSPSPGITKQSTEEGSYSGEAVA